MTDATAETESEQKKSGKMPMIIGLVLALAGGAGGFFATSQGLILTGDSNPKHDEKPEAEMHSKESGFKEIAFVPIEPLTISMPRNSRYTHLRFRGELEVSKTYSDEVKTVLPRVVDVLNSYLRALDISDIEEAASLARLRSQMLRRVQIVVGPGRVNDLLIMEFVLN